MRVPLKHPKPNIEDFREIILKRKTPLRVPFAELHIDREVIRYLTERELNGRWVEPSPGDRRAQEAYLKNYVECWYRLGYDFFRLTGDFRFSAGFSFASKRREGEDTASLSRGKRRWTEEGKGIISSWEDFERYPWPSLDDVDIWPYEFLSENLPEGMGIFACPSEGVFEALSNSLFGYENLCYLLYDDPKLVEAASDRVGELIYGFYERIVGLENLAGFFQGDDLGFKSSTLIPPESLRKYVLPWHKKIAKLAHDHGLLYLFHSCGNLESIMEDLIEDVKIDAKHSFEDEVTSAIQFKRKYGDRMAVLGGVDVDKLCRLGEEPLREYVRNILNECMRGGGYALGSGNSITNYMPVRNYLIMLDEGLGWGGNT
ncbi:MAG: uroporphyrinogen decarboxylase family protein [bacterium]